MVDGSYVMNFDMHNVDYQKISTHITVNNTFRRAAVEL